ncbi:MAG: glycine-rich protein [Candidatus Cybelea sp.]
MKTGIHRYAPFGCVAAALLAGCGGSQPLIGAPGTTSASGDSLSHQKTFNYTGAKQSFTVPTGVSSITIVALGAEGASAPSGCPHGGLGGRVSAVFPVEPHERLVIVVGGAGAGVSGGYSGGAAGGTAQDSSGYGGGGDSDVRAGHGRSMDRRLVAGGGGGAGGLNSCTSGYGGKGGKAVGGSGGDGEYFSYNGGGGGGGGSSFVVPSAGNVKSRRGAAPPGNGRITISW